ncbi:MAG: hypothetical protein PVH37_18355 [Desulfobacterales bacterium]
MKKKPRVIKETVKTRHTAHWDWDYLTWKEIEQRLGEAGIREDKQRLKNKKSNKKRKLIYALWLGLGLLVVGLLVWVAFL